MSAVIDAYTAYYTEKLWSLLPAVYHDRDAELSPPGQLRAFIKVLARRAADLRVDQDRLWDNQFIDLADDGAVPYIGELLGTRLVSALNPAGRRADVAKTIYYRRRKGTPRVLEELIADIGRFDGKLVEEFRRLGRARHGLDPQPMDHAGAATGTPPGGLADLRSPRGAALADGPFDEYHHTPSMRRGDRWGITKLGVHLYRLTAYRVQGATPVARAFPSPAKAASIDPSGRDIPLFTPRQRAPDWDAWTSARPWELTAPLDCRLMNDAQYLPTANQVAYFAAHPDLTPAQRTQAAESMRRLIGLRIESEARLRQTLASLPPGAAMLTPAVIDPILRGTLTPDCGKAGLLPGAADELKALAVWQGGALIPREKIAAGSLDPGFRRAVADKALIVDPERGRLYLPDASSFGALAVDYHYGFSGPVGAGPHARAEQLAAPVAVHLNNGAMAAFAPDGVSQIDDSATYAGPAAVTGIGDMILQAGDGQRPFLRLAGDWDLTAAAGKEARLTLDGVWIGGAPGAASAALVLHGTFARVTLRTATLDPGGLDATGAALPPVMLRVKGIVRELILDRAIAGPVVLDGGVVEKLTAAQSILQSTENAVPPLNLPLCRMTLQGVSVLSADESAVALHADELDATDSLIAGRLDVTDTQRGCFRFSAAAPPSRAPHPYRSVFRADMAAWFVSLRFGDPGYAQLSEAAPAQIGRGAESGGEMGAFGFLMTPIREDGLIAKLEEYMPFGLVPVARRET